MSMAYVAVAITVVAAAVSAYGQYTAGENAKEAADYNAKVNDEKARDSLQRGADEASDIRARARRVASAQNESFAMSGVEGNTGTSLLLLQETAGMGELDALRTVNNSKREAWGFKSQSELDRFEGRSAKQAGIIGATGTMLNAAGSAAFKLK